MAIVLKDGFEFFEGFNSNLVFNLDNNNFHKKLDYLKNRTLKYISISSDIKDLYFLKDLEFIEEIYFSSLSNHCDEIYNLNKLKRMYINNKGKNLKIRFSEFLDLEILSIDWYDDFPDLSNNVNLLDLSVWKFKPKSKSMIELSLPEKLKRLHITESNITDLKGIIVNNIEIFEAYYCNSLTNLEGIQSFSSNLQILILDYCKKLSDYSNIENCKNLGKIILGDCGDIPSIKWLNSLEKVNHFSFWGTKLIDGDTSPCFGIDYVSFKNAKHYNHKIEEFRTK